MKTTIDLPDGILARTKIATARRRTVIKNLVIEGLEAVLQEEAPVTPPADALSRLRQGYHLGGKPVGTGFAGSSGAESGLAGTSESSGGSGYGGNADETVDGNGSALGLGMAGCRAGILAFVKGIEPHDPEAAAQWRLAAGAP